MSCDSGTIGAPNLLGVVTTIEPAYCNIVLLYLCVSVYVAHLFVPVRLAVEPALRLHYELRSTRRGSDGSVSRGVHSQPKRKP